MFEELYFLNLLDEWQRFQSKSTPNFTFIVTNARFLRYDYYWILRSIRIRLDLFLITTANAIPIIA